MIFVQIIQTTKGGWGNQSWKTLLFGIYEPLQSFSLPTKMCIQLLISSKWYSPFIQ